MAFTLLSLAGRRDPVEESRPFPGARIFVPGLSGPRLVVALKATPTGDHGVVVLGTAGDLVFRKIVYGDGRFHVQLEHQYDRLALAGFPGGARLTHGSPTTPVVPFPGAAAWRAIRQRLADTPIMNELRLVTGRLESVTVEPLEPSSVWLTTAVLAALAGDLDLVNRVGLRLATHLGPSPLGTFGGTKTEARTARTPDRVEHGSARRPELGLGQVWSAWFRSVLDAEAAWFGRITAAQLMRPDRQS
jgi:hypothetical protein